MREILFRGQMRKKGEKVNMAGEPLDGIWIYGGIFAENSNSDRCIITSYEDLKKHLVHADTVGQFTGLTDKNGRRIFEGDIVERVYYDTANCVVIYDENTGKFRLISVEDYKHYTTHPELNIYNIEQDMFCIEITVLGNVHDNPEMLDRE